MDFYSCFLVSLLGGSTAMGLSEGSRREERELLGMLWAVGGKQEQEILVTGDFSSVQNWDWRNWWFLCSGGLGSSILSKLKGNSSGVLCLFRGFALIWACSVFCGSLWALCVPAQPSCASCGAPGRRQGQSWKWDKRVRNGIDVLETRKNAAGGKLLQKGTCEIL